MKSSVLVACLALALSAMTGCAGAVGDDAAGVDEGAVRTAEAVTVENFAGHPRVVEIREIVRSIDESASRLAKAEKKNLCEGMGEGDRTKLTEGAEVRKLVRTGGTDDSAYTETFYYEKGVLRFSFREISSVHPIAREDRRYFDERGEEIIWVVREATGDETHRPDMTKGKNRLGGEQDSFEISDDVKKNPAKAFDALPECY